MKIAIIGANNGLSQELLSKLEENAYNEILQVYNNNDDLLNSCYPQIQIKQLFEERDTFDVIFFFASHIGYELTYENAKKCIATNVNLLNELSNKFTKAKIINTSTVSIFKETDTIIKEDSDINPRNYYSTSKLFAEKIVEAHKGGGVNLRVSSLFGKNMKENTFLPIMVKNALEHNEVTVFGNGERVQNYISYHELCAYLLKSIKPENSFLFPALAVHQKSYSNMEIVEMLQKMQPGLTIINKGKDNSSSYRYNNRLTKTLLNLHEDFSFKKELKKYYLWKKGI